MEDRSAAATVTRFGVSLSVSDDDFWFRHLTLVCSEHRDLWCRLTKWAKGGNLREAARQLVTQMSRRISRLAQHTIERRRIEASTLSGGWAARRATWNFTRSTRVQRRSQIFEIRATAAVRRYSGARIAGSPFSSAQYNPGRKETHWGKWLCKSISARRCR